MSALIWIPEEVFAVCQADADRHYPCESGGALLGYRNSGEVVVTAMIDGGSGAVRTRASYEPDVVWQNSKIAEHYERSGRMVEFLGDWHSHPDTTVAVLSSDDKAVMRKIIKTPAARAPEPFMCILAGSRGNWHLHAWRAELVPRRLFGRRLMIEGAQVMRYRTS